MENLIVSGKFSFNSYNAGDTYIGNPSDTSEIKLNKYYEIIRGTTPDVIEKTRELSQDFYISPDKEVMIISEKLPGWSNDIPKAYLFKYNTTSKKYTLSFEITQKRSPNTPQSILDHPQQFRFSVNVSIVLATLTSFTMPVYVYINNNED